MRPWSWVRLVLGRRTLYFFFPLTHDYFLVYRFQMRVQEDPYETLFLWSVLCNMQEMALFMWERGKKNLERALIAGKLYNLMARLTKADDAKADVTDQLTANFKLVLRIQANLCRRHCYHFCLLCNNPQTTSLYTCVGNSSAISSRSQSLRSF